MLRDDQRIEEIRLVEVGPFEDSIFKFPKNESRDSAEIHIFTGENGSGKSTLLYALASLFLVPDSPEHPLSDLRLRFRSEHSQISANYFGRKYHVGKNALNRSGGLLSSAIPDELRSTLLGFQNARNRFDGKPVNVSFLPLAYSGQRSLSATGSLVIKEIAESPLQNHLFFGASVFPERILQWIANIETQSALALKDKDQKAADSYRDALNAVTNAVNEICEDNYSFALQRKPLNVVLKRGELELDFDVLPDGLKSIISWIADVLMRMDRVRWVNPDQPLLHQPLILFLDENAAWEKFRNRNCYGETRMALLNISGTTCAFCAGGFAQSPETVEHFRPKAGAHAHKDSVLDWTNLFPACMRCQQAKGEKFPSDLLKPDEPAYSPWRYFIANADDGSLEPLPNDEPHRAQVTSQTYDLNRPALKVERRRAIRQLQRAAATPVEEYRFLAELFPA